MDCAYDDLQFGTASTFAEIHSKASKALDDVFAQINNLLEEDPNEFYLYPFPQTTVESSSVDESSKSSSTGDTIDNIGSSDTDDEHMAEKLERFKSWFTLTPQYSHVEAQKASVSKMLAESKSKIDLHTEKQQEEVAEMETSNREGQGEEESTSAIGKAMDPKRHSVAFAQSDPVSGGTSILTSVSSSWHRVSDSFLERPAAPDYFSHLQWPTIAEFTQSNAEQHIRDFVGVWVVTPATKFCLITSNEVVEKVGFGERYTCEVHFSKPTARCPNPLAVAKVYFTIYVSHLLPKHFPIRVTYQFEGYKTLYYTFGSRALKNLNFQRFFIDTIIRNKLEFYKTMFECRHPTYKVRAEVEPIKENEVEEEEEEEEEELNEYKLPKIHSVVNFALQSE